MTIRGMSRNDLPALCCTLGFKNGAEVGVWEGKFTKRFCDAGLHMLAVDSWTSYPAYKDHRRHDLIAGAFNTACETLKGLDCYILRQFSVEAAQQVEDRSLDFVYIDGNHSFLHVVQDLEAWSPKVKSGGLIAGHDYREFKRDWDIRVVEAVHGFTQAHDIEPWFVLGRARIRPGEVRDRDRSFMWVNP